MKKSTKNNLFFICPLILVLFMISSSAYSQQAERYFYQLKTYHLKNKTQEKQVDQFLQTAYVPALHRAGIENVGIFKPAEEEAARQQIYVFIPFRSLDEFQSLPQVLEKDRQYLTSGSDYLDAAYDNVPYDRIESILLYAFTGMPQPALPELKAPKNERVYELRTPDKGPKFSFKIFVEKNVEQYQFKPIDNILKRNSP